MNYTITAPDAVQNELWQEKSIYILSGGFKLDKTTLPTALTALPKGALLKVNFTTRVANAVKSAILYEQYTGTATAAKFKKNHLFKAGDYVAYGSDTIDILSIDTSNALYDAITLSAQLSASNIAADSVLFEPTSGVDLTPKVVPNAINYFEVTPLTGTPGVTALGQAYEIKQSLMPYGINAAMVTALGARFMFI